MAWLPIVLKKVNSGTTNLKLTNEKDLTKILTKR